MTKTRQHKHKKLMIFFWNLDIGGVQKKMIDIANYCDKKDEHQVQLHLVLRDRSLFNLDSRSKRKNVSVHYRPYVWHPIFHVPFSLYCFWEILTEKPDVVLTFLDHASFIVIIASRILFWRTIRVVLNEDVLTSKLTTTWIKQRFITWLYPHADLIISPTRVSRRDLITHFVIPARLIVTIPNWTMMSQRQTRGKLKSRFDLLYLGRFDKQKNLFFLLDVLSELKTFKKTISLCLVGDGPERIRLQKEVSKRSLDRNIFFFPPSQTISDYLRQSTIFVLTSHYEGMPVALLEAMAARVPIVVKNYPGVSEYITHTKTGLIAHTKQEFIDDIMTLLTQPTTRTLLKNNALQEVHTKFGQSTFKQYVQLVLYGASKEVSKKLQRN